MHRLPILLAAATLLAACATSTTAPAPGSPEAKRLQAHGLVEKFDRFDYNGDGFLSRTEIAEGIRDHQIEGVPNPDEVIRSVDTNGDGRISLGEAQTAAARH